MRLVLAVHTYTLLIYSSQKSKSCTLTLSLSLSLPPSPVIQADGSGNNRPIRVEEAKIAGLELIRWNWIVT